MIKKALKHNQRIINVKSAKSTQINKENASNDTSAKQLIPQNPKMPPTVLFNSKAYKLNAQSKIFYIDNSEVIANLTNMHKSQQK